MDAAAEIGRFPVSKHQLRFSLIAENERADAGRDDSRTRLARPNSQAQTGTGKYSSSCSVDHEESRIHSQHYTVDPYS